MALYWDIWDPKPRVTNIKGTHLKLLKGYGPPQKTRILQISARPCVISTGVLARGHDIPKAGMGVGFKVWGLGSRVEVWGLGSRVWGLGLRFGVSGLGFGV